MTRRLAAYSAILFLGTGILDVLLRVYYLGFLDSLTDVLQDPAKTTMHILLLPLATYVLVSRFPNRQLSAIFQSSGSPTKTNLRRVFAVGWAIVLVAIIGYLMVTDPQKGFCERWPTPSDISDASVRSELASIRRGWSQDLASGSGSTGKSSAAYQAYETKVNEFRMAGCNVWTMMSVRGYVAVILTFEALFAVGVFVWLMGFYGAAWIWPSDETWEGMATFLALIAPWIALRPLSEWIINFGVFEPATYKPWAISIVVLIGTSVLLGILRPGSNPTRTLTKIVGGFFGALALVAGFAPHLLTFVAEMFVSMDDGLLFIFYLFVFFFIFVVFRFIFLGVSPESGPDTA